MDKLTIGVAAGVLVLVGSGLFAAAGLRTLAAAPDLNTPQGVVLAYAQAEQRGDGVAAWDLLAASTQARTNRDRFLARLSQGAPSDPHAYLTTENEQITANDQITASVVLVRTYPGS